MGEPGGGGHDLHFSLSEDMGIAHAVPMTQGAGNRDGNDFHVIVGVGGETCVGLDHVVIQYAQLTETHALR